MGFPYTFPFEFGVFRSASASMGMVGVAGKQFTAIRSASGAIGVIGVPNRGFVGVRDASAAFSLAGTSGRGLGALRSASAALSLVGTSDRILGALRSVSAALGVVGTSARSWVGSRLASAALEMVGATDRGWIGSRSAEAVMSIIPPILSGAIVILHMDEGKGNIIRDSSIKTDFLNDGTPSASSEWPTGGYEAWRAFDNNVGTRWSSANVVKPHWIKYDLGVGITKIAKKLRFKPYYNQVKDFTLQGSNDDSEWDIIYTGECVDSNAWHEWEFPNETAYRYYRVHITTGDISNQSSIWEIELMESNDGTIYGASWVDGRYGKALSFDISDDYVDIPNFMIPDDHTIVFSMRLPYVAAGAWRQILACRDGTDSAPGIWAHTTYPQRFHWKYNPGNLGFSAVGPGGEGTDFVVDTPYNIIGVKEGTTLKLYVNGSFVASTSAPEIITKGTYLRLGKTSYLPRNMILDEVRVYPSCFTAEDVIIFDNLGAQRHFVGERSASAGFSLSGVADRIKGALRSASASMGISGATGRTLATFRSSSASIGLTGTAARAWVGTRLASAAVGLSAVGTRFFEGIRSAAASIGVVGAAERTLYALRSAAASMSAAGIAIREWIGTRSNSAALSLIGATDRLYSAFRSASAIIAFQGGNLFQNPSLEEPWYLVNYTDADHEINRPDWWTISYSYANSDKLLALEENSIVRERLSAIRLEYLMTIDDFTGHLNISNSANRIDIDENSYLEGGDFQKGIVGPTSYSDQTFIFYDSENQHLCRRWAYATAINEDAGDSWKLLSAIWQPSHLDPNSPTTGGNIPYIPKGATTAYFCQYFVWHGGPTEREAIFDKFFAFQWSEMPTDQQRTDRASEIWDISSRAFEGTRTAIATISVQGVTDRILSSIRSAVASISSSASATRGLVIERMQSATVGLTAVSGRMLAALRGAAASVTVVGDTIRGWVGTRSSSAAVSAVATATRSQILERLQSASTELVAVGGRAFEGVRSAVASMSVTAVGSFFKRIIKGVIKLHLGVKRRLLKLNRKDEA